MRISKTIPIPDRKLHNLKRWDEYPIHKLKVGESIKTKDLTGKGVKEYSSSYHAAGSLLSRQIIRYGLRGEYKVAIYKTKTKKELRIWKVK